MKRIIKLARLISLQNLGRSDRVKIIRGRYLRVNAQSEIVIETGKQLEFGIIYGPEFKHPIPQAREFINTVGLEQFLKIMKKLGKKVSRMLEKKIKLLEKNKNKLSQLI